MPDARVPAARRALLIGGAALSVYGVVALAALLNAAVVWPFSLWEVHSPFIEDALPWVGIGLIILGHAMVVAAALMGPRMRRVGLLVAGIVLSWLGLAFMVAVEFLLGEDAIVWAILLQGGLLPLGIGQFLVVVGTLILAFPRIGTSRRGQRVSR